MDVQGYFRQPSHGRTNKRLLPNRILSEKPLVGVVHRLSNDDVLGMGGSHTRNRENFSW